MTAERAGTAVGTGRRVAGRGLTGVHQSIGVDAGGFVGDRRFVVDGFVPVQNVQRFDVVNSIEVGGNQFVVFRTKVEIFLET